LRYYLAEKEERELLMFRLIRGRWVLGCILLFASVVLIGCHSSPPAPSVAASPTTAPALTVQQSNQLIAEFRQEIKATPHDTSDKIGLATELNRQGKTREAISVLKEAEKTSTDPGLTRTAHKFAAELEKQSPSTKG